MLEELKLLQEIVGDLSSVGGWVAAGVIAYKLLINMTLMIGGAFFLKYIADMISAHVKSDITRQEADQLRAGHVRDQADKDAQIVKANIETERVKHMYKILKESKGDRYEP